MTRKWSEDIQIFSSQKMPFAANNLHRPVLSLATNIEGTNGMSNVMR